MPDAHRHLLLSMAEPPMTNSADFASRAMALVIDFALLAVVQLLLFSLLAGQLVHRVTDPALTTILVVFFFYAAALPMSCVFLHIFYFTLFHAWAGQTIGKMIMGIRVITQDNRRVSFAVAFLRWCGYILSSLPLATGFLWSAVDKDHRAWHDKLAQTLVISGEMT